jgi:hypothetical protein
MCFGWKFRVANAGCLCWLGDVDIDIFTQPSEEEISSRNLLMEMGGSWSPSSCQAWQKVAIIIPYRDRYRFLMILLNRLHPMLQRQQLSYRIFVIEQVLPHLPFVIEQVVPLNPHLPLVIEQVLPLYPHMPHLCH